MALVYTFQIRCTRDERERIKQLAADKGYKDATALIRHLVFGQKVPAFERIARVPGRAVVKKNVAAFGGGHA